jgi:hypothetical protein
VGGKGTRMEERENGKVYFSPNPISRVYINYRKINGLGETGGQPRAQITAFLYNE